MGRAIVRDADAFLFDEPLSNLDAKLRGQMRTEIARLQKRLGITTVYVTHDQTEAMTLGDRVAVLKRGILQQLATPRELYEQPGQPLRRRLHRLPADELHAGHGRGQPRSSCRSARCELPADKAEKAAGQGPADRRHPARALRGRQRLKADKGEGSTFQREGRRRRSGWATRPTPTSRSRRRRRCRPSSSSSSGTSTARRCAPSSSSPSTAPAAIAEGDDAEIWVDSSKIHLFDPATGENLTVDRSNAGRIAPLDAGRDAKEPATA